MKIIKYLPLLFLSISCSAQTNLEKYITDEDGIIVEKPDSGKNYDDIYNNNNAIFKDGRKIIYKYYYQNKEGEKFLIKKGKEVLQPEGYSTFDWEFIDFNKPDNETINAIILRPNLGNPFGKDMPDYNQTSISYEYLMHNGKSFGREVTGAIENDMNIWIHPPRSNFFRILELNPFPYIKAPYEVGTNWNWKLKIGDHWSDKRWLEWKGGIENNYDYKITEKKNILTKLGNIDCYIIEANAKSKIGETELISYFNSEFGFVKLEYKNIDGTKTVIEIEKIE